MAAAMTEGVQSVKGCGTTIKHLFANNSEDNRMGVDCIISERAIREIYLKGFEIAVKTSQPMAVMTSYNMINGIHAANNYDSCTKALRNEWGFHGLVMTDWMTTTHSTAGECTASGCMRAGNDIVMPGAKSDHADLREEIEKGTLKMEDLKRSAARVVNCVWNCSALL
jgi:beta-glucosidase